MAVRAARIAGRVSTIATQIGGKNVTIAAASGPASTLRPTFTINQVEDKSLLLRALIQLVKWVEDITATARSAPITNSVTLRNVVLQAGVTTSVKHMLGREPNGYFCVRAQGADFSAFEPTLATSIASSTNATPIVITTAVNHNLSTGQSVVVTGHNVNTAANGTWVIDVTGATTFSLRSSVGVGVGAATGTVTLTGWDRKTDVVLRSVNSGVYDLLVY